MQKKDYVLLSRRGLLTLAGSAFALGIMPMSLVKAAESDDPTVLFNQIRQANGLSSMATDTKLEQAALYQAKRMASHRKMGHSIGWGNDFASRLVKGGIRGPAAENVAAGQQNTRAVFDAWMNSSGHRKNMLDPAFTHYGLAWATPESKPNYIYWALMLGVGS